MQPRTVPHHKEAEKSVIGAMIRFEEERSIATVTLSPEHFYLPQHQEIFTTILELHRNHKPVDFVSISDLLEKKGKITDAEWVGFCAELTNNVITSVNFKHHVNIIKDRYKRRQIIRLSQEIAEEAYNGTKPSDKILYTTQEKLYDLQQDREPEFVHISKYSDRVVMSLQEQIKAKKEGKQMNITPTGFYDLDTLLNGGMRHGGLYIVGAESKHGKTCLLLSIALRVLKQNIGPVALVSLEMTGEELHNRINANLGNINTNHMFALKQIDKFLKVTNQVSQFNLFINDKFSLSFNEIADSINRLNRVHGPFAMIGIDYLQLLTMGKDKGRSESRNYELGACVRGLKCLAGELRTPVLVPSQLTIPKDRKVALSASLYRDCGEIQLHADGAMLIGCSEGSPKHTGPRDIILDLHRHGPAGECRLYFRMESQRFEPMHEPGMDEEDEFLLDIEKELSPGQKKLYEREKELRTGAI
jgi:replicative DNA helicase